MYTYSSRLNQGEMASINQFKAKSYTAFKLKGRSHMT